MRTNTTFCRQMRLSLREERGRDYPRANPPPAVGTRAVASPSPAADEFIRRRRELAPPLLLLR